MKKKYPLFEQSNLFFRDMQYAILHYFELKDKPIKYEEAEKIAHDFINRLVSNNELIELNHKTWKVNFSLEEKQSSGVEAEGVLNE